MIRIHQFFYFIFISLLSQGFIDLILSDASATPSAIYDLGQLSNTRGTTEPVSINDQTIVLGNAISKSGEKFTPFYWTRWSGLHEIRELKNHRAITGNARLDVLIPEGVFSEGHLKLVPAAEPNVSIFAEDLNDSNEMVGSIFPFHRSF